MLKHGIIKEKFSTLLTDSIRSEVLEVFGYKSDIVRIYFRRKHHQKSTY